LEGSNNHISSQSFYSTFIFHNEGMLLDGDNGQWFLLN